MNDDKRAVPLFILSLVIGFSLAGPKSAIGQSNPYVQKIYGQLSGGSISVNNLVYGPSASSGTFSGFSPVVGAGITFGSRTGKWYLDAEFDIGSIYTETYTIVATHEQKKRCMTFIGLHFNFGYIFDLKSPFSIYGSFGGAAVTETDEDMRGPMALGLGVRYALPKLLSFRLDYKTYIDFEQTWTPVSPGSDWGTYGSDSKYMGSRICFGAEVRFNFTRS